MAKRAFSRTGVIPCVVLLLIAMPAPIFAASDVPQDVLGSGGTEMSSANFSVRGTVAQPSIGTIAGDSYDGNIGYWYLPYTIVTGIPDDTPRAPIAFALEQNHPNPFNPTTVIQYALPRPSFVALQVFDASGKRVATLIEENMPAGIHRATFDGSGLASGVYFYRIQTQGFVKSRKLVLLK